MIKMCLIYVYHINTPMTDLPQIAMPPAGQSYFINAWYSCNIRIAEIELNLWLT